MLPIILAVVAAFFVWVAAAFLAGMARPSADVTMKKPVVLQQRAFHAPKSQVIAAYQQGVQRCPGTSVIRETPEELLVDSKPSIRLLGGAYGLVIQFKFDDSGGDTTVSSEASKKVGWSPATSLEVRRALVEIERRIRMAAKQAGPIEERR